MQRSEAGAVRNYAKASVYRRLGMPENARAYERRARAHMRAMHFGGDYDMPEDALISTIYGLTHNDQHEPGKAEQAKLAVEAYIEKGYDIRRLRDGLKTTQDPLKDRFNERHHGLRTLLKEGARKIYRNMPEDALISTIYELTHHDQYEPGKAKQAKMAVKAYIEKGYDIRRLRKAFETTHAPLTDGFNERHHGLRALLEEAEGEPRPRRRS